MFLSLIAIHTEVIHRDPSLGSVGGGTRLTLFGQGRAIRA